MRCTRFSVPVALFTSLAFTCACSFAAAPLAAAGGPVPKADLQGKKLIRWAAELTAKTSALDVPGKVGAWQQAGYDGLCFNLSSHANGSEREALLAPENKMFFRWWCLTPRRRREFLPDIEAYKRVEWGRLTDNFLLTAVRPLYSEADSAAGLNRCPDWFRDDDFAIVLANARLAAGIAREIGFKGIVFDVEAYGWAAKGPWRNPWSYPDYRAGWYTACGHPAPLPFAEVAAKVRQRGREWARALSDEFPDIVVLVAPGLYETTWRGCARTGGQLADSGSALWPAFVDGMLLGLGDDATITALAEGTYAMSQYRHLVTIRNMTKQQALILSTVPDIAARRIRFAAGLWTDLAYGRTGSFSNTDPTANHRDPKRHEYATGNALAVSDDYAWHYGEASYFLVWGEGYPFRPGFDIEYEEPPALIREYWQANVRGHEPHDLNWAPAPLFDGSDYSAFNADAAKRNRSFWAQKDATGAKVVLELPEYWQFLYDQEVLGRLKSYPAFINGWAGESWFRVDSSTCWQSQGIRVNGYAWYGANFDVPAELDVESQELFLTFAAYGSGSVNIYLNGGWIGYLPKNPEIDVTAKLKPGESNTLVLGFLNKTGPGGLAGDVKILGRARQ